ncbi:hypothetical protein [Phyllobacterium sp. YR531]|uniref:hypothetical protein n=1 Tax=Phyllobacterium sp. YR531 TaxID=1144343 RepID=UPI00026FC406|nr:hypothetical protein [Phyllobacterium sp. YR531]EJM99427.1 hypothetical protein PMI41_04333 [Phyllobacterium sp. YR531]
MSLGATTRQQYNPPAVNAFNAPEDVFLAWLMSRPCGVDIVAAASSEIIKLEAYAGQHAGAKRLHDLFCALIEEKQALAAAPASRVPQ